MIKRTLALLFLFLSPIPVQAQPSSHRASLSEPRARGVASWYETSGYTAAHRTLPMGSRVRVTNPHTRRSVVVTITDRGPWIGGRSLDLSIPAAQALGLYAQGVAPVVIERIGTEQWARWHWSGGRAHRN